VYTVKGKAVSADFSRNGYRLPTEAEWEYAARSAGRDQTDYSGSERVAEVAWYEANSGHSPHPVATKAANSSGFHDLSGNVWEWCWDYFQNYSAKDQTDPVGPAKGKFRILRGGSCNFNDSSARTGFRSARDPAAKAADVGFRVVRRS
jgi:formylglycine-generating enzyme required for sulfatase activity